MKRKKIIISFDSSGELMVLVNKETGELVKTSKEYIYNWYKGNSNFNTPLAHLTTPSQFNKYEWIYR